jgi:putative resolvase
MDELITPRKASELLGVTIDCLRKWERADKIKCIKTLGGHRRYRLKEIQQLINKKFD